MAQVLASQPGNRLEPVTALNIFDQLGSSLSYCHSKEVTHRHLSLEHLVLLKPPGRRDRFHMTLVDFHSAMVARGDSTSKTVCGSLPCIAPEVAAGLAYVPWRADCWSARPASCSWRWRAARAT